MKRLRWIWILVGAAILAACTSRTEQVPELAVAERSRSSEGPSGLVATSSPALSSIDSLMWQRPDSALMCLLPYFDTACRDGVHTISTANDWHYANLLLAELLYKNDNPQLNRTDLLQAVNYYDSLCCCRNAARHVSTDPTLVFLEARAHYINGVGYYEHDSVVEACEEYLKALEVMEGQHKGRGKTMKKEVLFMALTNTRLSELFSDKYLHEQAIFFGKKALSYYDNCEPPIWHITWLLDEIGSHYDMMGIYDSAFYYYNKGLLIHGLDTNNLSYRDLATHLAFLSYEAKGHPDISLQQMYSLLACAESEKELLSRCLSLGEIYYQEQQFDSAYSYLYRVYNNSKSIGSKKQAAEWLVNICNNQGKEAEAFEYANFLVPFSNLDENQSEKKSQVTELYNAFRQKELEQKHLETISKKTRTTVVILGGLLFIVLAVIIMYLIRKRDFEKRLETERNDHKTNQEVLGGKLKESREELRLQKEETENLKKAIQDQQQKVLWTTLDDFMHEEICIEIMTLLKNKSIKREAKKEDYPELHLDRAQLDRLSNAVEKHFCGFEKLLTDLYPRINRNTINQCLLYLLNLEDVQIAALLSCDYSTINRRASNLKRVFGTEKDTRQFIRNLVL